MAGGIQPPSTAAPARATTQPDQIDSSGAGWGQQPVATNQPT